MLSGQDLALDYRTGTSVAHAVDTVSLSVEQGFINARYAPEYTVDGQGRRIANINEFGTVTPIIDAEHWINNGAVIHTVTDTKQAWDTGEIRSGETKSVTFDTAGVYDYNCVPHPWMIGRVTVT